MEVSRPRAAAGRGPAPIPTGPVRGMAHGAQEAPWR